MDVSGREEADLCRAADVAFEETAISRSDDLDDVARLDREMTVHLRLVLLDAHDRRAGMSDRAGR